MEVILLEKQHMGSLGDKVNVKPGYARNYLFPQGKAVPANEANIAKFEARRAELEKQQAEKLAHAQKRVEQLEGQAVVIKAVASDEGKLFGSIGTRDIANALTAMGFPVEKREVLMPQGTLREIGEVVLQIQVHADLTANVTVQIIAEE